MGLRIFNRIFSGESRERQNDLTPPAFFRNVVVTGEDAADVGGIAGRFTGVNIKNCYHTTEYPLIGNGEAE